MSFLLGICERFRAKKSYFGLFERYYFYIFLFDDGAFLKDEVFKFPSRENLKKMYVYT